jgi:hypothetical protein
MHLQPCCHWRLLVLLSLCYKLQGLSTFSIFYYRLLCYCFGWCNHLSRGFNFFYGDFNLFITVTAACSITISYVDNGIFLDWFLVVRTIKLDVFHRNHYYGWRLLLRSLQSLCCWSSLCNDCRFIFVSIGGSPAFVDELQLFLT